MKIKKLKVCNAKDPEDLVVCDQCGTANEKWRKRCKVCGKYLG